MKINKYIRFIGNFKDLKPMGYTFQRLYARDYNTYRKSIDPEGYSDSIWIWQAGRMVECNDLHQYSYLIIQELIQKNRKGFRHPISKMFPYPDTRSKFILDAELGELLDWSPELSYDYLFHFKPLETGIKSTKEEKDAYCKRFRDVNIQDALLTLINELIDKNMIEITDNEI